MTSRPVRNRIQPSRNKDNVQLNLELIEKLQASRANKIIGQSNTNYAKLLSSLVNSMNEKYKASLTNMEIQRKDISVSKKDIKDLHEGQEWAANRERKRFGVGSSSNVSTRATRPSQQTKIEKNNSTQIKPTKNLKPNQAESIVPKSSTKMIPKEQIKKTPIANTQTQPGVNIRKPFRRSSYHIGIAYTIYMAQIRQKNPNITDPKDCDPTYFARRLKVQGGL